MRMFIIILLFLMACSQDADTFRRRLIVEQPVDGFGCTPVLGISGRFAGGRCG